MQELFFVSCIFLWYIPAVFLFPNVEIMCFNDTLKAFDNFKNKQQSV